MVKLLIIGNLGFFFFLVPVQAWNTEYQFWYQTEEQESLLLAWIQSRYKAFTKRNRTLSILSKVLFFSLRLFFFYLLDFHYSFVNSIQALVAVWVA